MNFIGNTLGTYTDKAQPKNGMISYAQIFIKVYLEKGLLEMVQFVLDDWNHIQVVDYEQLLFKCKKGHEYGIFSKNCARNVKVEKGNQEKEDQWNQVKRNIFNEKIGSTQ